MIQVSGSAKTPVRFRQGGPEDFDALIELNRQTYGDDFFVNRAHFDWQYTRGPDGPAMVFVAVAGERIVGCCLGMLQTMSIFGQSCLTALRVGVIVHKEFRYHLTSDGGRRLTIFGRLAELADAACAERGVVLTFAFPNANAYPTYVRLLGYRDLGALPFYARPVRPGAAIGERLPLPGGVGRRLGRLLDPMFAVQEVFSGAKLPPGVRLEEVKQADDRVDRLWERCQPMPGIVRRRDRAYLQWRFFDSPAFDYRIWLAMRDGEPVGYVAAMTAEQKDRERGGSFRLGHIVDFLVEPGDSAAGLAAGLVRHAWRQMSRERPEFVIAGYSGPAAGDRGLRRGGLWRFPEKFAPRRWPCIVRVLRPELLDRVPDVYRLENWFLNLSDNDIV